MFLLLEQNILTTAMCVSVSLMCLCYKEPVFALILSAHSLSVTQIGLVFSIDTIAYAATSFCLNFVKEERNAIKYRLIMLAGLIVFGASMNLTGPAPYLAE